MNQTETIDYKHGTTYAITVTALMTAVTCILAPLSIPIGPVPISLTNLAIYISLYLLGWKRGTISYLIYLLIGLVGIPVFSGFTGGPAKLAGPTGGYIIGFIVQHGSALRQKAQSAVRSQYVCSHLSRAT